MKLSMKYFLAGNSLAELFRSAYGRRVECLIADSILFFTWRSIQGERPLNNPAFLHNFIDGNQGCSPDAMRGVDRYITTYHREISGHGEAIGAGHGFLAPFMCYGREYMVEARRH